MSFSDEVKHELTRIKSFQLAEIAALIRMEGSIRIINKKLSIKIKIYQGDLARRIFSLIKEKFNLKMEIRVRQVDYFNKNHIYELIVVPQKNIRNFLIELGFLDDSNNIIFRIKKEFIEDEDYARAYLRGAFLGGGSINDPHGQYHLEIRCTHKSHAEDLLLLLDKFDLNGHINEHNSREVVYFKSYDEIIKFLNLIGAKNAQLKMENIHILKDVKNKVNRKVNAETANLDKTVEAAMKQLENIQLIEKHKGLINLSESLQEIAILRKENPYASLKELGEMLDPPLTKSGVNHRMRRLKKIAEEIKKK
ncbi:MAG: DNA-binding protein WhiA [Bacillota bacterium]